MFRSRVAILENKIAAAEATANSAEEKAQSLQDKEIADNESRAAANDNDFNPALSVILQGTAANYSRDPDDWFLPGFQTGGEAGLLSEGLSLRESELVASANVDSLFYAQFTLGLPRWRIGLRYDRLNPDNRLRLVANTTDEAGDELAEETGFLTDYNPRRLSAMLDWAPSEFSRLRLQYSRDESRPEADDQFFLQYIMTIGAHGAHRY